MIRAAAVLFVVVFGFVLGASAQDFKAPEAKGRVYFTGSMASGSGRPARTRSITRAATII